MLLDFWQTLHAGRRLGRGAMRILCHDEIFHSKKFYFLNRDVTQYLSTPIVENHPTICNEIDFKADVKLHRFVQTEERIYLPQIHISYFTCKSIFSLLPPQQVTQAGEILILIFGIQLAYASRNAITQFRVSSNPCPLSGVLTRKHLFQERQFLVASIVLEFLVSLSYYIIRDWYLAELNPTTLFLALFIRSQLTSTISLVLIFLPKIYYQHKQVSYYQGSFFSLLPNPFIVCHPLSLFSPQTIFYCYISC